MGNGRILPFCLISAINSTGAFGSLSLPICHLTTISQTEAVLRYRLLAGLASISSNVGEDLLGFHHQPQDDACIKQQLHKPENALSTSSGNCSKNEPDTPKPS